MAYCVLTDLYNHISMLDLIALTDDTGSAIIPNATVTAQAIADADAEIDAYLYGKYDTPLSPVPTIIQKMSADIAIYNMSGRRGLGMPEDRKARYDSAIGLLQSIQKGSASIGSSTPDTATDSGPIVSKTSSDRTFNMDAMANY